MRHINPRSSCINPGPSHQDSNFICLNPHPQSVSTLPHPTWVPFLNSVDPHNIFGESLLGYIHRLIYILHSSIVFSLIFLIRFKILNKVIPIRKFTLIVEIPIFTYNFLTGPNFSLNVLWERWKVKINKLSKYLWHSSSLHRR